MYQHRKTKLIWRFLTLCLAMSLLLSSAWAEGIVIPGTLEVYIAEGTGIMPENAPALPFANVYWRATPDVIAECINGQIIEQYGITQVEGSVPVEGIEKPVRVVCTYNDGKMIRAAMILEESVTDTISFTDHPDMAALQSYVSAFFDGDDNRYTYHGAAGNVKTRDIWMGTNAFATVGYFGSKADMKLGAAFYPPNVFNRGVLRNAENVSAPEASNQFYSANPAGIEHEFTGRSKSALLYNIQLSKANKERNDIPYFILMFMYSGTVQPKGFSSLTFVIDGFAYTLSAAPNGETTKDGNGEYKQWITSIIGPDSRPVLDALAQTADTVQVRVAAENISLAFDLPEETRLDLANGSQLMEQAGGWSGHCLDYSIDGESLLTIAKWEAPIPSPTPEPEPEPEAAFNASESILPFIKLSAWNLTTKDVTKIISGTVENVNKQEKLIRSTVDIPGLGNGLPVTYIFTGNKLTGATLIVDDRPDTSQNPPLNGTPLGRASIHYYNSFGLQNTIVYHGNGERAFYILSDRTTVSLGYIRNTDHTSLGMKFYAPVKTNINVLKKAAGYQAYAINDNLSAYVLDKPHFFTHELTYRGSRYSYSYFIPQLAVQYPSIDYGRVPYMMFAFAYNGIQNPGQCKSISFDVDGTIYRFTSLETQTDSKTQYGEFSATFKIYLGPDNISFMDALKKAKRTVKAMIECDGFGLLVDMPKQSKQHLLQAYSLLEKSGGLNPIYMDWMYYEQTPMKEM